MVSLTLVALFFEVVIGLVAGVLAGIRRNSFFDNLVLVSSTLVVSIPILVLAFVSQFLFGLQLGWFPIAGTNDGLYSYILPGLVLAAGSLAYVARLTRTSLAENLRADYVRTARAKGLSTSTVVVRHTLRNSPMPGRLNTDSVTMAPPMSAPMSAPMKVMTGIRLLRSVCRMITRLFGRPLAFAVRT